MVCVYLIGPGGVGKTTLITELVKKDKFKDFQRISEVARNIIKKNNLTTNDFRQPEKHLRLQWLILKGSKILN